MDLFFNARTTAAGPAHVVNRSIQQVGGKFVATAANRFRMQPRDLRHPLDSAMPQPPRLPADDPAALLLVQPAQQQVQLVMIRPFRMLTRATRRAATLVNQKFFRHRPPSMDSDSSLHLPTITE